MALANLAERLGGMTIGELTRRISPQELETWALVDKARERLRKTKKRG